MLSKNSFYEHFYGTINNVGCKLLHQLNLLLIVGHKIARHNMYQ